MKPRAKQNDESLNMKMETRKRDREQQKQRINSNLIDGFQDVSFISVPHIHPQLQIHTDALHFPLKS